jgi:predicted AlkP superfamily pyrophosphatase or phosphodiesterase
MRAHSERRTGDRGGVTRRAWIASALVALVGVCCLAPPFFAQTAVAPVVLISIDGLRPDYVLDADRHGLRIPNLRRLLSDGAHAKAMTGVLPTVTYPSHTTLVTGVSPARHGILYNTPFDPFGKNENGWMWYAEDITAPTLWEVVRRAGGVTSSVDWPVTVGAPITFNIAQFWRATTADDHKLLKALSTPGLLEEAERSLGLRYPAGYIYTIESDTTRAAFNAWIIEHKRPRFHTAYFSVLDEVQHATGPASRETFEALEAVDGMVGRLRAAALAVNPAAVVCVVSDHGFARYDRTVSVNVALREAGLLDVNPDGTLKDWRAITWGSAVMMKDDADQAVKAKVRQVLDTLAADQSTGVFRVLDSAQARALGGFPGAAFVVGVRPGVAISGRFDGPLVKPGTVAGTHGLLPEVADMDATFLIAGGAVPRGRVFERIDMRDVAPTLAALASVSLPGAEGRNLLGR